MHINENVKPTYPNPLPVHQPTSMPPNQLDVNENQQKPTLQERVELFDAQKKRNPTSHVLSEENIHTLDQQIETVNEKQLVNQFENLPETGALQRARSQIQLAQTLPLVIPAPNLELSQLGLDDETSRGFKKDLDRAMFNLKISPEELLKNHLREHLAPLLEELSQAEKKLVGSDKAIAKVQERVEIEMHQLMLNFGSSDELSQLFKSFEGDKTQLREIVKNFRPILAELVGELREGKPRRFEELSAKKQKFVDQVFLGLYDGVHGDKARKRLPQSSGYQQTPTELTGALDQLQSHLRTRLGQLSPGQLAQLKHLSNDGVRQFFVPVLGKSQFLDQLLVDTVRKFSPTAPRELETHHRELNHEDLQGPGVVASLQALSQAPGSGVARQQVLDSLLPHLQDLINSDNSRTQLQLLGKQALAVMLKHISQVPLTDEDSLWLAQKVHEVLPAGEGELSRAMVTLSKPGEINLDVPERLTMGGKTYLAREYVAKAGYGVIFRYEEEGHPEHQIAVKLIVSQGDDMGNTDQSLKPQHLKARQEILREINLHRELQGQGSESVVELKSVLSGPDDKLYMVQEYAPGGNTSQLANRFDQALEQGLISPEARQLLSRYVVRESLEAMRYMHDDRQMLHLDLKPENLMLGEDGRIKLIDFGTSQLGTQVGLPKYLVDNPDYKAPESIGTGTMIANTGSDIWSIGTLAFRHLVGTKTNHSFFDFTKLTQVESALQQFMQNSENRFMVSNTKPLGREIDPDDSHLIDSLMMPLPEQRLSAQQALQHPSLQDERLLSPVMQRLFRKLAEPLPEGTPEDQQLQVRFGRIQDELRELGLA